MNKEKKNIFLIGFMGAGKSTIARAISKSWVIRLWRWTSVS